MKNIARDCDPSDRSRAFARIQEHQMRGEIVTGLLYIDESRGDMHKLARTVDKPLNQIPYSALSPGAAALEELQKRFR